jgi:hypothetical protein
MADRDNDQRGGDSPPSAGRVHISATLESMRMSRLTPKQSGKVKPSARAVQMICLLAT